ncbi:roadblock/LC7 domain-containing protein [Actinoallomurus sp. NBC_01490]|jgi:predicted regulator of Ras-like GTPase activity (Roadblock/LC7/MglB family)|uniref:roadblock/LC7 domain-containing protein n=1 Tax=Actinoallomurus sp. NBC_01490 TaxID=2903557 RepID=UPI002E34EB77|nr:roadblock/LC7 domain-containing protein [Actinoallomurus sp. NBC_01490]
MLETTGELGWLLDDLVGRVHSVRQAMILSGDGLPMGLSRGITPADAEHFAALSAGFHSLARSVSTTFGGGDIRQTVVELEAAFVFVMAAGDGSCLAVFAEGDVNIGVIGYEMTRLVKRVRRHLGTAPRSAGGTPDGA